MKTLLLGLVIVSLILVWCGAPSRLAAVCELAYGSIALIVYRRRATANARTEIKQ